MKTLFLMGILFFLGAIATKKPDQTAWDSARDLGAQAQHIISKVQERTAGDHVTADTFREPAENLVAGSLEPPWQEAYREPRRDHNYGGDPDISETNILPTEPPPPGGDTFSPLEPEQPSPGIFPDQEAMFSSEEEAPPLPRLPAAPVLPVQVAQPGAAPVPKVTENGLRLAGSPDYGEVKALYEKASRLLDEIE